MVLKNQFVIVLLIPLLSFIIILNTIIKQRNVVKELHIYIFFFKKKKDFAMKDIHNLKRVGEHLWLK